MDFSQTPFIVIWETTRACDLACRHCRATAQPTPLPGELTTEEGYDLINQVADMGASVMVFSGGDPLTRADLASLIRHAKRRGLRVGTIPAATPRLTRTAVQALKDAGLDQMALSLDFSTAQAYDGFRGVEGAFARIMDAAAWAHEVSLPLQLNTVMMAGNFHDVDRLIELVRRLGIVFWEVFFLVPVGRGSALQGLTAHQYEAVFEKLYALSQRVSFTIKVTEGMHYRRYMAQQRVEERHRAGRPAERPVHRGPTHGSIGTSAQTVNAGKGHVFVSSTGEVCPSGFLPLPIGNIRQTALASLYRTHPLFRRLRDPDLLKGRCGRCEFRRLCGGSRARAFAMTGDYLAEDPCCAYLADVP